MLLIILTLITALSLSIVAAYYSIVGLTTIFAASVIPIIVMASILEVGKLVTTVWLHENWKKARFVMKAYLSFAVVILMIITSMGIFGFLSKAHIEQTSSAAQGAAQIERIQAQIDQQELIVDRAEEAIAKAENSNADNNASIQAQIDAEQQRIDTVYTRIQPAIDEQNAIISNSRNSQDDRVAPYNDQLAILEQRAQALDQQAREYEQRLTELAIDNSVIEPLLAQITQIEETVVRVQGQIASGEREQIRQAQTTIGANADGSAGPNTRRAANAWIEQQQTRIAALNTQISDLRQQAQGTLSAERTRLGNLIADIRGDQSDEVKFRTAQILETIDQIRNTEAPEIADARAEIARIRAGADGQIAQGQALIERLREQITVGDTAEVDAIVDEQTARIQSANAEIEKLLEEKFALETEARAFEAEVGPIKYIAALIYDDAASTETLESAVRFVIMMLVFVFDPLAIMMLLAATESIAWHKAKKKQTKEFDYAEYEQARAQKILDNSHPAQEKDNENYTRSETEGSIGEPTVGADDPRGEPAQGIPRPAEEEKLNEQSFQDVDEQTLIEEFLEIDQDQLELLEIADEPEEIAEHVELDYEAMAQQQEEEEKNHPVLKQAKTLWKDDNPGHTLKEQRILFFKGLIDELPWDDYLEDPRIKRDVLFGKDFPEDPTRGDLFVYTRNAPSTLHKFNGEKWITVNKATTDQYSFNNEYIAFLIDEISNGAYDPDLLTDSERAQIEDQLQKNI